MLFFYIVILKMPNVLLCEMSKDVSMRIDVALIFAFVSFYVKAMSEGKGWNV